MIWFFFVVFVCFFFLSRNFNKNIYLQILIPICFLYICNGDESTGFLTRKPYGKQIKVVLFCFFFFRFVFFLFSDNLMSQMSWKDGIWMAIWWSILTYKFTTIVATMDILIFHCDDASIRSKWRTRRKLYGLQWITSCIWQHQASKWLDKINWECNAH